MSVDGRINVEELKDQLIRHEGLRLRMYKDSLGIATIGVGHNLEAKPISRRAALVIEEDDIQDATNDLTRMFPWTFDLDDARRNVLINMCFNMGIDRLSTFKNTLELIRLGQYEAASENMLKSKWAVQVGRRAIELAQIMKEG